MMIVLIHFDIIHLKFILRATIAKITTIIILTTTIDIVIILY